MRRQKAVRTAFGSMMSGLLAASMMFGGGSIPASAADDDHLDPLTDVESLAIEDLPQHESEDAPDETIEEDLELLQESEEPVVEDDVEFPAADGPPRPTPQPEAVAPTLETSPAAPASRIPAEFETLQPPGEPEPSGEPEVLGDELTSLNLMTPYAATNPPLPQKCGVSVAIVLDMSSSLNNSHVTASKQAARAVVTALEGTPSEVGVYYFGTVGHKAIGKTSVSTSAGANLVRDRINTVGRPSSGTNYTNWDDAFQKVIDDGADYDIVLFVTDGQPNRHSSNGSSAGGSQRALNEAVATADILKGQGTTILGVGVGTGIQVSNIVAISGPSSYYTVANYDALTGVLKELAEGSCRGTVSVVKQVVDRDGNSTAAGGWEFSATSSTSGTTFTPSSGMTAPSTGAVNFDVHHPIADSVNVQITETQQPGYQLLKQDGANAVCTDTTTGTVIPVTNVGGAGFSFTAGRTQVVSCSVLNQEVTLYEPLTVDKTAEGSVGILHEWDIEKSVDKQDHNIPAGQSTALSYTVDVIQDNRTMTAGSVDGTITVSNPNDRPMVATITDTLGSGQQCTIDGIADFDTDPSNGVQIEVPASGLTLDYSCALVGEPASADDSNTVSLTWDRGAYPQTEEQFNNPGTAGTGTASDVANFTYAYTVTGESVAVEDVLDGVTETWTVTWQDGAAGIGKVQPHTYTVKKTPEAGTCETYVNVASLVGTELSDSTSVSVCSGADLVIDKTTAQSFSRSYNWDIEKTDLGTGPYTADPLTGDVTVDYRVTVSQGGFVDSGWLMSGTITVQNPNDWQDIPVTVLDEADFGQGVQCTVTGVQGNTAITDDDPAAAGFQTTIPRDTSWTFNYACSFGEQPDYAGENTAVVEWDGTEASTPSSRTTDTINVAVADWDMTPINSSATIADSHHTFLGGWNVTAGTGEVSREYSVTWNVGEAGTCQEFTNTATLTGSDQLILHDSQTIEACREADLSVDKTVTAEYDRIYHWTIDKGLPDGDPFGQFVGEDGNADYTYLVTVDRDGYEDSGWRMSGDITVTNPNDYAPVIVTVSDSTTIAGAACLVDDTADIDTGTPGVQISVPASGSVTVSYECALPDLAEADYDGHTNAATVTFGDGQSISSDPVDINFALGVETDRTVEVLDDKTDPANPVLLGTVDFEDAFPQVFEYDMTYTAPTDICVDYLNTAWVDVEGDNPTADHLAIVCGQSDLSLFSTVDATYDRDFDWEIEKTASDERFDLALETRLPVEYEVVATATDPTDTNKTITGMVRTTNPNAATDDVDAIDIEATVTGSISVPGAICTLDVEDVNDSEPGIQVLLAGGEVLEIPYSCIIPGDTDIDVTYTNTVQLSWGVDESVTFEDDFTFEAVSVTNDTVDVTDTMPGRTPEVIDLGTAAVADSPVVFTYREVLETNVGQCRTHDNTATIVQTQATDTASVVVCAGADLEITKNVIHSFDRTYLWDIEKEADQTEILTDPDTGMASVNYTVTATPRMAPEGWNDSGWQMSGEVTVTNPNDWRDIEATVTDSVDIGGGATCTVTGGTDVLIRRSDSVTLPYTCTFTSQPDYSGTNTATVTWDEAYSTPNSSASGTADIDVDEWSMDLHNTTVTVMDDKTDPANPVELGTATWNADGVPGVFNYSLDLEGTPGTCVDFTNTAWINQTGQEASWEATVCDRAELIIGKTVDASYDRTYLWDIEKSVDETLLEADSATGEGTFSYTVEAIPSGYADSDWTMSGSITVENPNDFESVTVDITDTVDVGGGAVCTVVDGEAVIIEAGETVTIDYDCTFDEQPEYAGINTVTVSSDIGEFTATADVSFALAGETDATVPVMDDKTDPMNPVELGSADWNSDGVPIEFTYDLTKIGVPGECVDYTNIAWIDTSGEEPTVSVDTTLCVSMDLGVEKTVLATYDRDYQWEIVKSVDDDQVTVDEETGSAEFSYLVEAIPAGYTDSGWQMSGEITVTNPNLHHPVTVTVTDITDIPGATCVVEDGVDAVLEADSTVAFEYDCSFTEEPWYEAQNVAEVVSGDERFTALELVNFEADIETNRSVIVVDDKTDPANPVELGEAEWNSDGIPVEFPYALTLEGVTGQCITFENTAWLTPMAEEGDVAPIAETLPSTVQAVDLCVEAPLALTGDVTASFDRTYLWDIDKSVDSSEVTVMSGTSAVLHYVVAVTPDGLSDSGHTMTGSVTITNINDHVDPVVTVDQSVSFDGLTCEVHAEDIDPDTDGIQVHVAAQADGTPGTVVIDYTCVGEPDSYSGSASVTAHYEDANENDQTRQVTNAVEYGVAEEINKTITILDDKTEPSADPVIIGTAIWNEDGIATEFDYALELDAAVGETIAYTNTAWIAETEQSDSETVNITADKPVLPIKPPAPKPPATPTTPPPTLPRTGVEGAGWLLALGGSALLLGGGLVYGTNRRRRDS